MPNKKKFWTFRNAADNSKIGELLIYGEIADYTWWGDEVTPKQFKQDLDTLGDIDLLNIYINSPGGDVFAGQAIYSMLNRLNYQVNVYIDGLAASAASIIAMVGDTIKMPKNAMLMIHNPWTFAWGYASDLRKMAEDLDKIRESIIPVYQEQTGKEHDEIAEMMDAETWMTADEALKNGFIHEIEEAKQIAASIKGDSLIINGQKHNLSAPWIRHAPKDKIAKIYNGVIPDDVSRETAPEDEQWTKPTLSDFTDQQWDDLSDAEKRRIAGHFAWADASPATTFGDLKLGHHRPSDGAVVWNGVANAAARLDQTDVPEEDKPDIKAHLGSHYRQFDKTPPWEEEQNKTKNPPKAELKLEENPAKNDRVFDLEKHLPKINQLIERRKNHERKA